LVITIRVLRQCVQAAMHKNSGEILMSKCDTLVTLPVQHFEVFNSRPIADYF